MNTPFTTILPKLVKPFKLGFVTGKFMPLHKGHELYLAFAAANSERLIVDMDVPNRPISTTYDELQAFFISIGFPTENIIWTEDRTMHDIEIDNKMSKTKIKIEFDSSGTIITPEYWARYNAHLGEVMRKAKAFKIDAVFTSDKYGEHIARHVGAQWVPVDPDREATNGLSATQIRADINTNFNLISDFAKDRFRRKVAIIGPESAGKTTMAKKLAAHFKNACYVPEWGRIAYEQHHGCLDHNLFMSIFNGQAALVDQASKSHHLTFSDTDSFVTANFYNTMWFPEYANHSEIERYAATLSRLFDHYIVLAPTVPFVNDGTRFENSQWQNDTFEWLVKMAKGWNLCTVISSTDYDERFNQAVQTIENVVI